MLAKIDDFLNGITMYRLVLYILSALLVAAAVLSVFKLLPFNALLLVLSSLFIIALCYFTNILLAWGFQVPPNVESAYITGFILSFLIAPAQSYGDINFLILAIGASVLAMVSKYVLAIKRKHIFNPAAIGLVLSWFIFAQSPSWWVGTLWMLPFVLIGGLLIMRKVQAEAMILIFLIVSLLSSTVAAIHFHLNVFSNLWEFLAHSPALFFAFVMLTEPQTTPPGKISKYIYSGIAGLLFSPAFHFGKFYFTPELGLSIANIFSYLASPKQKMVLKLREIETIAKDTYNFVFEKKGMFDHRPGQYLEWTVYGSKFDTRGNRRYFTIASSPTEEEIIIGVKLNPAPSTFKKHLVSMKTGDKIIATGKAGDFTLPRDKDQKLVFIAGGIGITPFRSMIKYLLDTGEKRDIVLFYSNRTVYDIAYFDIFEEAYKKLRIKTIYTLTDIKTIPKNWPGQRGFVDEKMIKREVPDFSERRFYLSGPPSMVDAFSEILAKMGVQEKNIRTDFFPGYA